MLTIAKLKECARILKESAVRRDYIIIHPAAHYQLKVLSARAKYRHGRWIPRWEKWSGKKYIEVEGEFGIW